MTATEYFVSDFVSNAGINYVCNTHHISDVPFDASKFTVAGGGGGSSSGANATGSAGTGRASGGQGATSFNNGGAFGGGAGTAGYVVITEFCNQ